MSAFKWDPRLFSIGRRWKDCIYCYGRWPRNCALQHRDPADATHVEQCNHVSPRLNSLQKLTQEYNWGKFQIAGAVSNLDRTCGLSEFQKKDIEYITRGALDRKFQDKANSMNYILEDNGKFSAIPPRNEAVEAFIKKALAHNPSKTDNANNR